MSVANHNDKRQQHKSTKQASRARTAGRDAAVWACKGETGKLCKHNMSAWAIRCTDRRPDRPIDIQCGHSVLDTWCWTLGAGLAKACDTLCCSDALEVDG